MNIEIKPWITPNFVTPQPKPGRRQDGVVFSSGIPLADVPAEDLAKLCDIYRAEIFRKAGKADPATPTPPPATAGKD